ncbi:MAG: cobalamin-dependent protein [Verrucomicrobia bacterium]|nr:cobalamin-dependent protein [Verrucomicrobiota bacterium]
MPPQPPPVNPVRLLLVNPNRYTRPPVPPVGLEYLVAPLRRAGHDPYILDLCFSPDPAEALQSVLDAVRPDAAGVTVRNVDSVLYHTNEFFLDDIAALAASVRRAGIPLIVGGSGVATMPDEVRRHLGADYAIDGPAEGALPELLSGLAAGRNALPPVLDGWRCPIAPDERHPRGELLDYAPYLAAGARFGFETQKGCTGRCIFCTEARRPVLQRSPGVVVEEIASLVEHGATELFCCDSEFNQTLPHCKAFLDALIARGLDVDWTLYMKPLPHDAGLFTLLARSGCTSVTLSVETLALYGLEPAYSEADVVSFVQSAKQAGVTVAIDLTVGLPGEPDDAPRRALDLFRRCRPKTVGVNAYLRLYPAAELAARVMADPKLRAHIDPTGRDGFLRAVHYHHLDDDALEHLIAGDPLFRVEGRERGVNYERLE